MRSNSTPYHCRIILFLLLQCFFGATALIAQQINIADFVLFGGTSSVLAGQKLPSSPGYAVQIGPYANIQGGYTGSYKLVKSTGGTTINGYIHSGGTVQLANGNVVTGPITAANNAATSGTILSIGSNANIGGNIDVKGNIVIGGGTVSGLVTHPAGTTYIGPAIGARNITGTPTLPGLPVMPAITAFAPYPNIPDINSTRSIAPGAYDDIKLPGNKTLTFNGPGVYVFDKIDNTGTNDFIFDFNNTTTGTFKIYVHNNVELDKIKVSMINGGSATRIFTEVHGNDVYCFDMNNCASGGTATNWLGTVWAPYSAINIGSGSGSSTVTGALWSGTQVNIQSNVTIIYAPFSNCTKPTANAGPDKALDFGNLTTLTGTSTTSGVTFGWQAINGGVITSPANTATITISAAGTYILTVTSTAGCFANDTVVVTGKNGKLIGSELQSVFQNFDPNAPPSPFFVIQRDSIVVEIITVQGQYAATLALLTTPAYGLTKIISNGASSFIITGLFPISKLPLLNMLPNNIVYARPYYGAISNKGIVSSAGDTAIRSNLVRDGYGIEGNGIKIGVISDSYASIQSATTTPLKTNTAAQDITNGDLPGIGNPDGYLKPVNVLKDYPVRSTDEGRGMLQIVHDVAPKAELYFRTGFYSPGDFAVGIDELKQAGCNIIVDDVTYITEPFLTDGVVANAVDAAVAAGTTYFSAAGNFANKSYENIFKPAATKPALVNGTPHDFSGSGDIFQNVTLTPGNYTIVLQWIDNIYSQGQTVGTKNDLDIYMTPNTDGTALFGFNRDNTNGDPIEILPFTLGGTSPVNTNILITNNTAGSNPARFKYIVFRGEIKFNEYATGTSTIVGQANALGAIAVGASRYYKTDSVESFSSTGGTIIGNTARNKPDIVAPDGVNTTVNLGPDFPATGIDGYSNFFGTSAAAPHAAGVAALIMEGRKKFLNQAATTPAQIRSLLQSTATDVFPTLTPGFDFTSGYGFMNADSALRTFAKPDPTLIKLVIPATAPTPGTGAFILTITGVNLSPTSVIKFRDSTLGTTIVNSGTATAVVPPFTGNPIISVYTPPVSASGLDGGTSDSLKFFSIIKKKITVTADSKTKKYGESLPVFTASILVDGLPLSGTTLTLNGLGLTNLALTTQATANSNVGTYIVIPARVFTTTNPVDAGLLELYDYTFTNGSLTIDKMPLKITPVDKTIDFGQHVGDIAFDYQFDQSKVPDPTGTLNLIKAYHQAFLPNNALAVIKDFLLPQSDGTVLSSSDLLNLNMIVSFEAIKNSRKFQLLNNKLVTLTDPTSFNNQYLVDVAAQSIFNYKNSPATASFINTYPGISAKAILSAASLANNTGKVLSNGSLVQMVNGSLVQMVNGASGSSLVPLLNGSLVQIVNGSLVQLVNGQYIPIANGSLVQLVNGSLVQLVNGEFVPLANGSLVQLVNGSLVQLVNGSLVQIVNGLQVPIINGSLVQLVNGSLVQLVNGSLVQLVNGSLVQLVNGSLVQVVNGSLVQLVNGSLVQIVNGSLVQLVNGSLVQIVNSNTLGTGISNSNTAVIFDKADALTSWVGPMFGINMITGLNAGQQTLVPGVLVNDNFDITYGLGKINILPAAITITPNANQTKVYGNNDPVFTYTNNAGLMATDFTGTLSRVTGKNAGTYAFTLGTLSAGNNYSISLGGANTFSITARPVTITPDASQSKVYGNADPIIAYTASEALQPGDTYTGMLGRTAGESVLASPYTYTLGTLSAGNNYLLTLGGTNTFTITARPVTITPTASQSKVYGSADPVFAYTASEALQPGDTYTGMLGRNEGENVGASPYPYTLGTLSAGTNYLLTLGGGNAFAITTKQISITPTTGQSKVYGSADPVFTYSNNGGLVAGDFTGALGRVSGTNVGTYAYTTGSLNAGANYSLLLSTSTPVSTFAITVKSVTITPNPSQSKIYGDADPVFTFTNNAGLIAGDFTGMLSRVSGSNVGSYAYSIGSLSAGNNYSVSIANTNTFAITKALLKIKADDKVIFWGDAFPVYTSTITGLKNGDNPTVKYALNFFCFGIPGVYTIIPSLNAFANSANYTISYVNGKLYINPKGWFTDDVDTYLECVETVTNPSSPSRKYIAHFYAKNTNWVPVYVAVGAENKLSSTGSFDGSPLPVVFNPGYTSFDIPFDGTTLKWDLITYEGNKKVTESVTASKSSKACNYYSRSASTTTNINTAGLKSVGTIAPVTIVTEEKPAINIHATVFPNPARNRATIQIENEAIDGRGAVLFDVYGKSLPVKIVRQVSKNAFEVDLSRLISGMYFMHVKVKNGYKTISIVKQ